MIRKRATPFLLPLTPARKNTRLCPTKSFRRATGCHPGRNPFIQAGLWQNNMRHLPTHLSPLTSHLSIQPTAYYLLRNTEFTGKFLDGIQVHHGLAFRNFCHLFYDFLFKEAHPFEIKFTPE